MGGQYHRNGVIDPGVNITGMNDPVLKKIRKFINMGGGQYRRNGGSACSGMGGQVSPEYTLRETQISGNYFHSHFYCCPL